MFLTFKDRRSHGTSYFINSDTINSGYWKEDEQTLTILFKDGEYKDYGCEERNPEDYFNSPPDFLVSKEDLYKMRGDIFGDWKGVF